MEAAPSAKPRSSPPIPPNYVSLRQLQELRLEEKEELEKRRREEEEAAAMAKREAARKPETKVSAVVSVDPVRAKERRDGGQGPQWVAMAHCPAVPPPPRGRGVPGTIGVGRGNKGPADAPRGGGKTEGKAKGEEKEKASTHWKKAGATPAPPTSAAADSVGELRRTAETKPESLVEGPRRPPTMVTKGAAEQKPRVVTRRVWPRLPDDRCDGAGEQRGRVWVPKAATGSAEL